MRLLSLAGDLDTLQHPADGIDFAHANGIFSCVCFFSLELRFKVPWGHLAAKAWGPATGRPVLCLHGWLDNANTFDKLIPLLPKENYYVALDFSGHGQSSHLPEGVRYQHQDYLSDVHRVTSELGWRKFSIMGHSMGGIVGGMFASLFPEKVQQLVLLDSFGFFPIHSDLLISHLKKLIIHYSRLDAMKKEKVYTSEAALQRLLEGNPLLNPDTAKVLIQRGTKTVPGGVVFCRDLRVTIVSNSGVPLAIDQCLQLMKAIQADVNIILAKEGLFNDQSQGIDAEQGKALLHGFKESLKDRFTCTTVDGNHFVHLNEPEKIAKIITDEFSKKTYFSSKL
ncbi:serine hydrolase-like protein 2 [Gastrophryne carolinensis]